MPSSVTFKHKGSELGEVSFTSVTFKHKGSELGEESCFTSVSFSHFPISSTVCVTMPGKPVRASVSEGDLNEYYYDLLSDCTYPASPDEIRHW
ncbi:hypothetical protein C0J52_21594 [Blattella germanica]|nr:hypothetical protein C0J52_21594 [Blattella germanica]